MTRDEHPLRRLAGAHVTQLRAERAEDRRIAAEENKAETAGAASLTATIVLGEEAATVLEWDVSAHGLSASVDLGDQLFLEFSPYPSGMVAKDGPPGFLTLVLRCSECGSRWPEPVESLEKLAHWLEDLPKRPVGREAGS